MDLMRRLERAAVALFSTPRSPTIAGMMSGVHGFGDAPERGTKELLDGYRTMPWLRAVSYRVAHAVSTVPWVLYRSPGDKRERLVQRAYSYADRRELVTRAVKRGDLVPVERHVMLDALRDANSYMVGPSLLFVTQVHLDLPGESFWVKERNGLGVPVGFWPIPPHWVSETPTVRHPFYKVAWAGWQGEIPETEVLWLCEPNPTDPYGRGSGLGRALADELETDEYAARHEKLTLINRARPDLIVWPEETKFDAGTIDGSAARRLGEQWRAEHQGFWRAALPYFATRKIGVKEVGQSFKDLGLIELREFERNVVIQVYGMPPEQLGIIENSNRSTIAVSDFLFQRNLVQPRCDFLRATFQERLVPEYDERLVIDYISPVEADKEHQLKVAEKAPWALRVDEWRAMSDHEPLPNGEGQAFMVDAKVTPHPNLTYEPPLPSAGGTPLPTGDGRAKASEKTGEWHDALTASMEAGDLELTGVIRRALADDPDDLPELSRAWARMEPDVRQQVAASLTALRDRTELDALERLLAEAPEPDDAAIIAATSLAAWSTYVADETRAWIADAFRIGVRVGADAAGLATKGPHPVFNRVNPEAVAWARRRAGELIDTQLNPASIAGIRRAVVDGLKLGWHPSKVARLVRESVGLTEPQAAAVLRFANRLAEADANLSDERLFARVGRYAEAQRRVRALTIARTELAAAASAGQQRLWDVAVQQGALEKARVQKRWLVTWDELLESRCEALSDEQVDVDALFSNGRSGPPDHPNCRCATGLVGVAAERATLTMDAQIKAVVGESLAGLRDALAAVASRPIHVTVPEREMHVHVPPASPAAVHMQPVINVPETVVHVAAPTINVPETVVHVAAPTINVPETVVHVAAPTVNVSSPDVTVAAPEVHVAAPNVVVSPRIDVHVPPAARRPRRVEYDAEGRVSKIVDED